MDATTQTKIDDVMQELDGCVIDWNDRLGARDIIARLIPALPSLPDEVAPAEPRAGDDEEAVLRDVLAFAYAHGLHEHGYDVVQVFREALSAPSDGPQEVVSAAVEWYRGNITTGFLATVIETHLNPSTGAKS